MKNIAAEQAKAQIATRQCRLGNSCHLLFAMHAPAILEKPHYRRFYDFLPQGKVLDTSLRIGYSPAYGICGRLQPTTAKEPNDLTEQPCSVLSCDYRRPRPVLKFTGTKRGFFVPIIVHYVGYR
jgi:hypothetical protein